MSPQPRIMRVSAAATYPLRQAVLRPGLPPSAAIFPGDDASSTIHLAAVQGDCITAIASLYRAEHAELPGSWQLRAMASAPEVRGQGHGTLVLEEAIRIAREEGALALWCNARVGAVDFYRRHGFETRGNEFDIPGVGPHFVMSLSLAR